MVRAGVKSRLGVKARLGNRLSVMDARFKLGGMPQPRSIGRRGLVQTSAGILTPRRAGLAKSPRPNSHQHQRNPPGISSRRKILDNFTIVTDARGVPGPSPAPVTKILLNPSALSKTIANPSGLRSRSARGIDSASTLASTKGAVFDPRKMERLQMTISNDQRTRPQATKAASSSTASFSASAGGVSKRLSAKAPPPNAHKLLLSNLASSVTEADVNELCESVGRLASKARILESGVAVAYFVRREDAELAVSEYNGRALDGVTMNLQLISQTPAAKASGSSAGKKSQAPTASSFSSSSAPQEATAMETEEWDSLIPSAERSKFNRLLKCRDPVGGPDPDRSLITSALFPPDSTKRERDPNVTFTVKI